WEGDGVGGAATAKDDEGVGGYDFEGHVVEHAAIAEGLGDSIEAHRDWRRDRCITVARPFDGDSGHPAASGNRKKIRRTRMTLVTMIRIDDRTTARVEARPTPSVPDRELNPRYDEIPAMMNPNTIVLMVAGT